jgi:hypothetical protein
MSSGLPQIRRGRGFSFISCPADAVRCQLYGASSTFDRPGVPPAAEREPAEQILGRAFAGRRDDVVIATKSGERRFDPAVGLANRV